MKKIILYVLFSSFIFTESYALSIQQRLNNLEEEVAEIKERLNDSQEEEEFIEPDAPQFDDDEFDNESYEDFDDY